MRLLNYTLILLSVLLSACSSGGSDSLVPAFNWSPGVYSGTFTVTGGAPDDVVLLVTSDNRFALATTDGSETAIGAMFGSKLTTTDGFTATLNAALSGTYTAPGVTGTFTLADSGLYNRASSTAKLEGTWVDNTFTQVTGTATYVIDATGNFLLMSVSGCAGTGSFSTIDGSKNEYNFTLVTTNCPGYDGTYIGLAITDDTTFTDDTIDIIAENPVAQTFLVSTPVKQ